MKNIIFFTFCFSFIFSIALGNDLEKANDAFSKGHYEISFKLLLPLAKNGNIRALGRVAYLYEHGLGVKKNLKEAIYWYRLCSDKGVLTCQHNMGVYYLNGIGLSKNIKKAIKLFNLAASGGYKSSQYNLGVLYANGNGVPQDKIISYMWFKLSEELEDSKYNMDRLEKFMDEKEINTAIRLSNQCIKSNYINCAEDNKNKIQSSSEDIFVTDKYSVNIEDWNIKSQPDGHVFICISCQNHFQLSITFGPSQLDSEKGFLSNIIKDKSKYVDFVNTVIKNQMPIKDGVNVNVIEVEIEEKFGITVMNYLAEVSYLENKVIENSYIGESNNQIVKITVNYFKENFNNFDREKVEKFLYSLNFQP